MLPTRNGSIRLFRFLGITVFLHWSWFLVAFYQVGSRNLGDAELKWRVLEYLSLFAIVMMHEFGHALACRSVGGRADQIVLWPLGGVAYVDPPQRPGATLWSIAAGPMVNALLIPIFSLVRLSARRWGQDDPGLYVFWVNLWYINVGLLIFNLLPIYPLDGGQILRSVLWFFVGRARSLLIASAVGLVASGAALIAMVWVIVAGQNYFWLAIIAGFALMQSWSGLRQARALARVEMAPRRPGLACPTCKTPPAMGEFWLCSHCRRAFDMFATQGVCPQCGMIYNGTRCLECGAGHPLSAFSQQ
jgi:Zn-dependent protease